ncbi:ubiquinone/menaquinone biosynthesis methyltransferase [Phenylobacterium sp.]|jgi:ubiquinone/menaquinone biosynthesis methyltransferase|uniref:ubiquinone/menaquinone biosynthesis methyltransferase n=1 Tax=Phenylobacterium sp. TaxID=1871053 RepID=UPI002F92BF67
MDVTSANAAGFRAEGDDVFGRIARRYDLLCDLFSLGAHRLWKSYMARRMAGFPGDTVLDLASGTGDIPVRLLRLRGVGARRISITDISPAMLAIAQRKIGDRESCRFALADAENLAGVADASVDVLSISFGMKICDRGKVIAEAVRVLKPGGAFLCLEAARIQWPWLHRLYLAYMAWCLPLIAQIAVTGDRSAYDYLLRGIREFPDQATFARELEAAGFREVGWRNLTFGIVALHTARRT